MSLTEKKYINIQEQVWISDENESNADLSLSIKATIHCSKDPSGMLMIDRSEVELIDLKLYKPGTDLIISLDSIETRFLIQIVEIAEAIILKVKSDPGGYFE